MSEVQKAIVAYLVENVDWAKNDSDYKKIGWFYCDLFGGYRGVTSVDKDSSTTLNHSKPPENPQKMQY